jgi:ariadne-1
MHTLSVCVCVASGCLYLRCKCGSNWCWHCGKVADETHHVYECNRPEVKGAGDPASEQNRYLFHFERFHLQLESSKTATKQIVVAQGKVDQLIDEQGMHSQQATFVREATELVVECRRMLAWSYARAFFLGQPGAEPATAEQIATKKLFEYQQAELEVYTERLNALTEGTIEKLVSDRMLVLGWTRTLRKYLRGIELDV